jgi:hypothetical protein
MSARVLRPNNTVVRQECKHRALVKQARVFDNKRLEACRRTTLELHTKLVRESKQRRRQQYISSKRTQAIVSCDDVKIKVTHELLPLPSHWEAVPENEHGNTTLLLLDSTRHADELASVTTHFQKTMPDKPLTSVYRIQSDTQYRAYETRKAALGQSVVELPCVFHGTRRTSPLCIVASAKGLDASFGQFAQGFLWFHADAVYSATAFSHPVKQATFPFDTDYQGDYCQILVCRVLNQVTASSSNAYGMRMHPWTIGPVYTAPDGYALPTHLLTFRRNTL